MNEYLKNYLHNFYIDFPKTSLDKTYCHPSQERNSLLFNFKKSKCL